jgi:hypothetical protein
LPQAICLGLSYYLKNMKTAILGMALAMLLFSACNSGIKDTGDTGKQLIPDKQDLPQKQSKQSALQKEL